jgi:hypothetical protein
MSDFVRGPVPDRQGHTPIGVSAVRRTMSLRRVGFCAGECRKDRTLTRTIQCEAFAGRDELRYTGSAPNEPVGCH